MSDTPEPTKTKKKTRRGRPKGSRTQRRDYQTVEPSRCPQCGSTQREAYSQTTTQEYAGETPDGRPYTHIIRRWTRCRACGHPRVDRTYEQRG